MRLLKRFAYDNKEANNLEINGKLEFNLHRAASISNGVKVKD